MTEHLKLEAEFADNNYKQWEHELALNPVFFRKYASPSHPWDYRERAAMFFGDLHGKRVFDMGCGMGEEATYFALQGASVTAMDISPVGVSLAMRRARANGVTIDARVGDVLANGLPAQSFDLVHGLGILHHVGLGAGLGEAARLLKPGGRAVFLEHMSTPLVEALKRRLSPAHEEAYTEHEAPLRWRDCVREARQFREFTLIPYGILFRLRARWPRFGSPLAQRIDYGLLRFIPALRILAGGVIICVES